MVTSPNSLQVVIRRVLVEDAAALAALSASTFYDTFTGTCTAADMQDFLQESFNEHQIQSELSNKDDLYFFAEAGNKPVGYLRLMEDYSNFSFMKKWKALELKRIYVDKDFHGKGIAQLLMKFAEDYAIQHQYEVLWLGVWEHNTRAQKFYAKSGFVDSGCTHEFPIGSTPQTDKWLWKFFNEKAAE